jgi:PAS domain S-box-containing protein
MTQRRTSPRERPSPARKNTPPRVKPAPLSADHAVEDLSPFFDSPLELLCIGDRMAIFQKLNPQWEATLGYLRTEMEGKDFIEFIHPEDRPAALDAFHEIERRKSVQTLTNRVRCKDGTYRWLEWKYILRGQQIFAAARDVTDWKQAEDALRESRQMLETVLNTIPARVFWKDRDSTYLGCNQSFAHDAGFSSPAEVVGRNDFQMGWAEQADLYRSDDRAVIEQGSPKLSYEEPGILAEGQRNWLRTSKIPLRDLEGNIRGVLGTYEDITKQKMAEKALRESEERYRQLFELESDAIFLIENATGRLLEANQPASALYGYTREEFLLMKNTDLSAEPEDTQRITQTTPAIPENIVVIPLRFHRRKDGSVFPVEITGRFFTWQGKTVHIAAIRDITQRRKTEEDLRESHQMFKTVLDTIPARVFWKDRNLVYLGCNQSFARDAGFRSPKEVIGKNDYQIGWADYTEEYQADDRLVIETGRAKLNYEEHAINAEGRHFWASTSKIPLRDPEGRIRGVLGTYEDITERKQAEEEIRSLNADLEQRVTQRTAQLEAANKELEAFGFSVSHDLRAPLRAIDGFTRILEEDHGKFLDEEGKRLCAAVRENTRRMNELIDDLLALSRLSRSEMEFLSNDMETMAVSVFQELTTPESRARIDFTVHPLPRAMGDPILLRQAWTNLVSNAIKFSSKQERAVIEIGCRSTSEEDVYSVCDNGAGFDMQYSGRLFNVFQRLHSSSEFEGTGVGLAIVQRVVRRHGGRVWAEGAVDKGATFYFTLPKNREGDGTPTGK